MATRSATRPDPLPALPFTWLVGGLVVSLVAVIALMLHEGLTIAPEPLLDRTLASAGLIAAAVLVHLRRPLGRAARIGRDLVESLLLFTATCLLGALATYPVAALSRGFVDGGLARIDGWLRFDWLAWYHVVAAHPWLQLGERAAYEAIYVSPVILFGFFALEGRRGEARRFLATFWLAALLTVLLFACLPCRGPLASIPLRHLPYLPESALWQAALIPELRDHQLHAVALGSLRGLVGAPSFHTASAVLYIAAAWPHARLRWPLLLLNGAMLLATPVEGTHYLADMIVGGAVAAVAIASIRLVTAELAVRERHPPRLSRSAPFRAA